MDSDSVILLPQRAEEEEEEVEEGDWGDVQNGTSLVCRMSDDGRGLESR